MIGQTDAGARPPKGPLAARWLSAEVPAVRAGAVATVRVALENAGTATWRDDVNLAYHWLDPLGNAIVWDGMRTPLPRDVPPGGVVEVEQRVRGPLPPGRYLLALDLVVEGRVWLAEVGNDTPVSEHDVGPRIERRLAARGGDPAALAAQEEPLVDEADAEAVAWLADGVAPAPDWSRRVLDAHQEGYAIVGGSIEHRAGFLRRRPAELEPYAPGSGRVPGFPHPLVCPSAVRGTSPDWIGSVAGLPAARPPADRQYGEPWVYDGRIALRARARR